MNTGIDTGECLFMIDSNISIICWCPGIFYVFYHVYVEYRIHDLAHFVMCHLGF